MNDPAVSKARDILQRLSADSEARRAAEELERVRALLMAAGFAEWAAED